MFFEDDNLLILMLITLGIYLTMDAGWLELTFNLYWYSIRLTKWFIN